LSNDEAFPTGKHENHTQIVLDMITSKRILKCPAAKAAAIEPRQRFYDQMKSLVELCCEISVAKRPAMADVCYSLDMLVTVPPNKRAEAYDKDKYHERK